jgi:anti-anti-sigma factor
MERFRIQTFDDSTHLTVRISGEVDLASAHALTQAFSLALSVERPIIVDCAGITFADSSALSVLAEARDLAEKCRVRFQLAEVSEPLRQVLELSDTVSEFDIAGYHQADGATGRDIHHDAGQPVHLPAAVPGPRLHLSDTKLHVVQPKPELEPVAA